MAYIIEGKKVWNLDNIECECGKRAEYVITEVKGERVVKLFCDWCGYSGQWAPLIEEHSGRWSSLIQEEAGK